MDPMQCLSALSDNFCLRLAPETLHVASEKLEKVNTQSFLSLFQFKEESMLIMFATVRGNYRLSADLRQLTVALATATNSNVSIVL